jgi:predicted MFS family arabinose efflux permease
VPNRVVDKLLPARLGTDFRWLISSSWVSNLGDGIAIAAGPLLVASQTKDPFLVASAALLQRIPWLLFGLQAGALADRLNRRLLVAIVDLIRAGVLLLLCLSIATGVVSVTIVLIATFLVGTAEVFADSTAGTLLPMLVERDDLVVANARLQAGFLTVNQLVGPPLGAALFAVGATWAFAAQALLVGLGAVLVLQIATPTTVRDRSVKTRMRKDIAEGFSWVLHNPAVRTLVLTIFIFNITFGAAWSVLVLYAEQRLQLGAVGFGLLTTFAAIGGVLGTASYGWITRRVSLGNIMRAGLIIETLTHLGLALTTSATVAMGIMFAFGAHAFVWNATSSTVRQRAVPAGLQGRVGSVNQVGVFGSLAVGLALGGVIARQWGVTAPFWFAFVGSAVFVVLIWGQLAHIAHADESATPPVASPS